MMEDNTPQYNDIQILNIVKENLSLKDIHSIQLMRILKDDNDNLEAVQKMYDSMDTSDNYKYDEEARRLNKDTPFPINFEVIIKANGKNVNLINPVDTDIISSIIDILERCATINNIKIEDLKEDFLNGL